MFGCRSDTSATRYDQNGLACPQNGLAVGSRVASPLAYAVEAAVLANWCKRDAVQHLHAHFGTNSAAIAMLAGRLSGIPYSFTAHGSEEFEKAPLLSLDLK